jgi:hypothetical protein
MAISKMKHMRYIICMMVVERKGIFYSRSRWGHNEMAVSKIKHMRNSMWMMVLQREKHFL